jgi:triosephosphate isomerase
VRRRLIVANWKMHKTIAQADAFVDEFVRAYEPREDVEVVIAPPFTALAFMGAKLRGIPVALGAQTMHWGSHGAFTGEISAPMLVEVGVQYVILGHSERRAYCDETDATVNLKVAAALEAGLTPIVAVGETSEQHAAGLAVDHVTMQTRAALAGLGDAQIARCVFAYEPIWAIGSGTPDTPEGANAVMGAIRDTFSALAGVRVLYGGSMKPGNAASFIAQPNIDGGLIGGASLVPADFAALTAAVAPAASLH